MEFVLQIALILACLFYGARKGGVALGLLGGIAFGVFYAAVGLPIAWLADRSDRRSLIAAAIGLWSVMTAACGLAGGFPTLFLARIGVGIGEAVRQTEAAGGFSADGQDDCNRW